jgi:hypothetical protein
MPDDDLEEPTEPQEPKRNFRRELEERAALAEERAARLERENAIYKAGLPDLNPRQIQVLASQIEGDPTPDTVKALAADLGWFKQETAPPADGADLDRITSTSSGSTTTPDPFAVLDGIDDEAQFWKQAEQSGLTTS